MKNIRKAIDSSNGRTKMINTERSVFVQGVLDESLFSSLAPKEYFQAYQLLAVC